MSSQILLSRGVAGPDKTPSPKPETSTFVTSIFESATTHFMTLGEAASQDVSGLDGEDADSGKDKQAKRTTVRCSKVSQSTADIEEITLPKRKFSRSSTFFDNPNDPCALLDDNLLEPCPHAPFRSSVSEVLNGKTRKRNKTTSVHSSLRGSLDMASRSSQSENPIATAFNDCRTLFPSPTFPSDRSTQPNLHVEHLEYMAVKSSSPWLDPTLSRRKARPATASELILP